MDLRKNTLGLGTQAVNKTLTVVGLLIVVMFTACAQDSGSNEKLMTITWPSDAEGKTQEAVPIHRQEYEKIRTQFTDRLNFDTEDQKTEALKHPMIAAQIEQMTLNKLIFFKLLHHEAQKQKITVTDEEVKSFKDEHLKKIGGSESFKRLLEGEKITPEEFDRNLKDELLIKKFVEKQNTYVPVNDNEARQFWKDNPAFFLLKERIKAAHILVKYIEKNERDKIHKHESENFIASTQKFFGMTPDPIKPEVMNAKLKAIEVTRKKQAEQYLDKLKKNEETFDNLARSSSDDTASGVFGGDLNYLFQSTTDADFWNAAMEQVKSVQAGQKKYPVLIETPVKTVFGYHIIRVDGYAEKGPQSFEEAKDDIVQLLSQQRKQKILLDWVNGRRQSVNIEFEEAYGKRDLFEGDANQANFQMNKSKLQTGNIGVIEQPEGAEPVPQKPYKAENGG